MTDWRLNFRAVLGRAYPRIIGASREPSWMLFDIFLPLLGIAAYIYYYNYMGAPQAYVGFVVLGGVMTAFWINVLWSMATQFYWEKETGNLQLYMLAPMSRMAVLGGMALGGVFFTTVRAASTFIVGVVVFGVVAQITDVWALAVTFILTMVALYGMGMLFSSLYMLYGRSAWHFSNLMQEPIYLVSGFYFPVKALGFWVALGASIIPITLGLDALRQLMFASPVVNGLLPPETELLILALLAVAFVIASKYALSYMEELGKREGRLTMRWQ